MNDTDYNLILGVSAASGAVDDHDPAANESLGWDRAWQPDYDEDYATQVTQYQEYSVFPPTAATPLPAIYPQAQVRNYPTQVAAGEYLKPVPAAQVAMYAKDQALITEQPIGEALPAAQPTPLARLVPAGGLVVLGICLALMLGFGWHSLWWLWILYFWIAPMMGGGRRGWYQRGQDRQALRGRH